MSHYDTAKPYVASYIIVRKDNKIAFVLRTNTDWMNGKYSLPSGKVEKKESFSAGATREAYEEIGIKAGQDSLKFVHIMHRNEGSDWVDVFFEPTEYLGEPYNAEPHMHGELMWLDPNNLPENVIPSVRFALDKIEKGVFYSEYGWDTTN